MVDGEELTTMLKASERQSCGGECICTLANLTVKGRNGMVDGDWLVNTAKVTVLRSNPMRGVTCPILQAAALHRIGRLCGYCP